MKTLLAATALAVTFALAAPAAEARVANHQGTHHVSSKAKAGKTAKVTKKAGKAKHKKHAKKGSRKATH